MLDPVVTWPFKGAMDHMACRWTSPRRMQWDTLDFPDAPDALDVRQDSWNSAPRACENPIATTGVLGLPNCGGRKSSSPAVRFPGSPLLAYTTLHMRASCPTNYYWTKLELTSSTTNLSLCSSHIQITIGSGFEVAATSEVSHTSYK